MFLTLSCNVGSHRKEHNICTQTDVIKLFLFISYKGLMIH
jgi:hypothetical protein